MEGHDEARAFRDQISAMFGNGLMTDAEVWQFKKPAINVMQLPGDGPFRQSRAWYSQFYNPRAMKQEFLDQCEGYYVPKGAVPYTDKEEATA